MRLFVAALAACVCVGTSALAADLPAPIYTKAPVFVDPGYNWTGFYVGGNLGYSWGRSSDTSTLANGAGTALFTSAGGSNLDGIVGGGQTGYNWQMQNWVWGLEADIQGSSVRGSISAPVTPKTSRISSARTAMANRPHMTHALLVALE